MRRGLLVVWVAMTLSFGAATAKAATCGFTAVAGLSFGVYDVFGGNLDTAGSIAYQCTSVLPGDTVTIDFNIGGAPSYFPRQMQSGVNRLDYNIYLDAARLTVWGDGTGGSSRLGPVVPVDGVTVTVPTFGRIPASQDAVVGTYTDTIIVTMSF